MSRRWARASLVVARAHFSSKLGIGVHVSAFHPGNQAPEVKALTSALPGVIGVIGLIGLIVVILGIVLLSASYHTPSKPFQFSDSTVEGTISGPSGGLATTGITGRALLTCDQPVDRALLTRDHPPADPLAGHPHPRQPFYPHPTPPRQHFNFSYRNTHFNFLRHLYAILPPMEPLFRSRRRLPPFTFYHGDTLFTTPFLPFLPRGSPGGAIYLGAFYYTHPYSRLYGGYTEAIRRLYGGYMEAIWRLYGGYTGGYTEATRGV